MDEPTGSRGWGCHHSLALWCPFVEHFAARYLPFLLGRDEAQEERARDDVETSDEGRADSARACFDLYVR